MNHFSLNHPKLFNLFRKMDARPYQCCNTGMDLFAHIRTFYIYWTVRKNFRQEVRLMEKID